MQGMQNKNVRYLITNGESFNMNSNFIKNGYFQIKLSFKIYFYLIVRLVTNDQRKIWFEVQFDKRWSVDSRLSSIIRNNSTRI